MGLHSGSGLLLFSHFPKPQWYLLHLKKKRIRKWLTGKELLWEGGPHETVPKLSLSDWLLCWWNHLTKENDFLSLFLEPQSVMEEGTGPFCSLTSIDVVQGGLTATQRQSHLTGKCESCRYRDMGPKLDRKPCILCDFRPPAKPSKPHYSSHL